MIKQQQVFIEENMSNLTSAVSGEASVSSGNTRAEPNTSLYNHNHQQFRFPPQSDDQPPAKKKRNLPGNPDPDAEVIALSPKSLLATNRFVCEICNKGFQRDQNLQLHRRGHNLPWKLKQRTNKEVKKKVYVCPEPSCVHHDPSRALGDLTGIKKHFCRKHGEKKWKCDKCSKRYAVQSDWKAHSKVCGTREYRCDCGTLFSRRDSFITHRAFCDALAEETARAITTNALLSNPIGPSTSHFINLPQQQNDPLHAFPLKREQHPQQNMMNLPPWLACSPIDHNPQLPSPSSSSSMIFHPQDQMMQPQNQIQNPSNNNMGPTFSSGGVGGLGGPYHTQSVASAAHMSATALLQKAAQMGATMSNNTATPQPHHQHQHQSHVSDTNSNTTTTAGLFGLNLSSRDHHQQQQDQNQIMPTSMNHLPSPNPNPNPSPSPNPSSSFIHDMMINSMSSSYDHHHHEDAFGIGSMGTMMGKKDSSSLNNGSNQGNDGLTRDFLGLRPLSHSEILTIAGLGNCMNSNSTTSHHQQDNGHKSWQG
ncbi:unnamed protein product [Amaranthus hypochondriacus]